MAKRSVAVKKRGPKPLPLYVRARRRYDKRVAKLKYLLSTLDKQEAIEGKVWCDKMRIYYTKQLDVLLANPPKKR